MIIEELTRGEDHLAKSIGGSGIHLPAHLADHRSTVPANDGMLDSQEREASQQSHERPVFGSKGIPASNVFGGLPNVEAARIPNHVTDATIVEKACSVEIGFTCHVT